MMKKEIDALWHITNLPGLDGIIENGLKPSYARETLGGQQILVAMISLSNILIRDLGKDQVIHYGDYGIAFSRDWGILNGFNPVLYTHDTGALAKNTKVLTENAAFLAVLQDIKPAIKKMSDEGTGPFSTHGQIDGVSEDGTAIFNYFTQKGKYDETLLQHISNLARAIHAANKVNIKLTKPYKVINSNRDVFIAYNDREWRRIYDDLEILFETETAFKEWKDKSKPHFSTEPYLITFKLEDIKAILIHQESDRDHVLKKLKKIYDSDLVELSIQNGLLKIGTQTQLEDERF
jgi:hypothetical protein